MSITKAEREQQKKIAREWVTFRTKFLFSQMALAEALGISRRSVQYTESGRSSIPNYRCIPNMDVLLKFKALKAKFEAEEK